MSFLCLEDLSKSYMEGDQRRIVLQNATVNFGLGEFVSILGKSGSGKTTLLNLISGIDKADAGEIYLDGCNLTKMNDLQRTLYRRQNIGFVFQFFNLIPTLTVWENVILPLELNGKLNGTGSQNAKSLLDEVGLADRVKAFPDRLSGGEQQRVAIARALVHNPGLVLADEPTGNLDEETGQHILALLDRLTRRAGKTMILVTHNPDAAEHADRILVLQDGNLHERKP
ncbi:MAG: ABC transporter ATP-binding protein [Anaerolineaceae bacterium]|nr:ABC transporter ATP-binding protein [Anaerolineaceae bacterium]